MRKYFLLHFLTVKILVFLFQKSPQEVPIVDTVVLSENGNGKGNGMLKLKSFASLSFSHAEVFPTHPSL